MVQIPCEVAVYWQWLQHLQRKTSHGRPLLLMNLDETCMRWPGDKSVGLVASRADGWRRQSAQAMTRGSATFVAVLCENKAIQKCLPCFLLCNKHMLSQKLHESLLAEAPAPLRIWRLDSSWNTSSVMCQILEVLASELSPWKAFCQPTITMDVAPCHVSKCVLERARDLGFFVVFVPSHLTPRLQVADVFCFRPFKSWWGREIQKLQAEGREVTKALWFELFFKVPSWLQSRDWKPAFGATCALNGHFDVLTKDLQVFGLGPTAANTMPTQLQIASLLPRKRCSKKVYSLLFTSNLD